MLVLPLALVASAVVAHFIEVTALCGRVLSRCCFGFGALVVGLRVLGRVPFTGCMVCASF